MVVPHGSPIVPVVVAAAYIAVCVLFWKWWRYWDVDRVLGRMAEGASASWRDFLAGERHELFMAFALRCEAQTNLDGYLCGTADELLRRSLERLGGLAGAW